MVFSDFQLGEISSIYGRDAKSARARFEKVAAEFEKKFGLPPSRFFSSPGRTEICGNHTDHNCGKVLGASICRDTIACASPWEKNSVCVEDLSYGEKIVFSPGEKSEGLSHSGALLAQICENLAEAGAKIGGFCAVFESEIPSASGISSSASLEMLFGRIISALFNGNSISLETLAAAGQKAEHVAWKKSVGLLDQIACAAGGTVKIDFENPKKPKIEKIPFDFASSGCDLLLVSTGAGHADLAEKYSAIPAEMRSAAAFFKKNVLREVSFEDVVKSAAKIRQSCGDRALLRAFHFFDENRRVDEACAALKAGDFSAFLDAVENSGLSSWRLLQNVAALEERQEICVFLAAAEIFAKKSGDRVVSRVHGGGFAGAIQVFCPQGLTEKYCGFLSECLGAGGAVLRTQIRGRGLCDF